MGMHMEPQRHRITVHDYHRLAEIGVLAPDARVELIEGEIIQMPPMQEPHATGIEKTRLALEAAFGREAELQLLPMQPGDMEATMADVSRLERVTGYRPSTTVEEGVRNFVNWYVAHYGVPFV